jgi:hypothetical protein
MYVSLTRNWVSICNIYICNIHVHTSMQTKSFPNIVPHKNKITYTPHPIKPIQPKPHSPSRDPLAPPPPAYVNPPYTTGPTKPDTRETPAMSPKCCPRIRVVCVQIHVCSEGMYTLWGEFDRYKRICYVILYVFVCTFTCLVRVCIHCEVNLMDRSVYIILFCACMYSDSRV